MSHWAEEDFRGEVRLALRVRETLHSERSEFQRIDVVDTVAFGRALLLDDVFMTSEGDEFFYHEMIVHPALVTHPAPRSVLIIGGGDGGTAREVLRHPEVESVRMVEIDRRVVEISQRYLPTIGTAWDDPRLTLEFADGVRHVKGTEGRYDVVLLDGSDPAGPATGLFDHAFYASVRRVLRPGGLFVLQSESPVLCVELYRDIQLALRREFEGVFPYVGHVPIYGTSLWSWTIATTDDTDPRRLDHTDRAAALEPGCRYYDRDVHGAAFAVPPFARRLVDEHA